MNAIATNRASARILSTSARGLHRVYGSRALSSSFRTISPMSVFFAAKSSRTLFKLSSVISSVRTQLSRQLLFQRSSRRFNSSLAPNGSTSQQAQKAQPAKKEGYFKRMSKKYGISVVYVYLGLSMLDFPVCFAVVHTLGQEKISEWEDIVSEYVKPVTEYVKDVLRSFGIKLPERQEHRPADDSEDTTTSIQHKPSLLTEAAIAYGIHKSLIFIRLPAAVAITPPIVKFLQRRFPKLFVSSAAGVAHPDIKRRFFGGLF
ncbi:hypothetical protein V1509DRAFT_620466 [Lipomyces kononenkoae]